MIRSFNWIRRWLEQLVTRLLRVLLGLSAPVRGGLIVASDVAIIAFAAPVAYTLRVGALVMPPERFIYLTTVAVLAWATIAPITGLYRVVLRYFGFDAVYRLSLQCGLLAVVLSTVLLAHAPFGTPRTMGVILPILVLLFAIVVRAALSLLLVRAAHDDQVRVKRRVLICGASEEARSLARSMADHSQMQLVAFIDPDGLHVGRRIEGRRVWAMDEIEALLAREPVDELFFAHADLSRAQRRETVERVREINPHTEVRWLPSLDALTSGTVEISDLRTIKVGDLLGRDMVEPRPDLLARLADRDVLVTGAGGSIGSELCRQLVRLSPRRLVLADQSEYALYAIAQELDELCAAEGIRVERVSRLVDLADAEACDRLFAQIRPDQVYHAAAYKHVPLVEDNVVAGVGNNLLSTINTVEAAKRHGVRDYLLVSTDKAVRPTNVMGASKRLCEMVVQHHAAMDEPGPCFSAVRFGNVLGSSGSVVPRFERQIAEGGPITLTDKRITRFFMTIPEAALLVIQAGAMARGGEVFLLDMGEPMRIVDLARTMVELAGLRIRDEDAPDGDIEIVEIGLRPGEKLFEELLIDADAVTTDHPRIVKAHEQRLTSEEYGPFVERMRDALAAHDENAIRSLLAKGVAGYRSGSAKSVPQSMNKSGDEDAATLTKRT